MITEYKFIGDITIDNHLFNDVEMVYLTHTDYIYKSIGSSLGVEQFSKQIISSIILRFTKKTDELIHALDKLSSDLLTKTFLVHNFKSNNSSKIHGTVGHQQIFLNYEVQL